MYMQLLLPGSTYDGYILFTNMKKENVCYKIYFSFLIVNSFDTKKEIIAGQTLQDAGDFRSRKDHNPELCIPGKKILENSCHHLALAFPFLGLFKLLNKNLILDTVEHFVGLEHPVLLHYFLAEIFHKLGSPIFRIKHDVNSTIMQWCLRRVMCSFWFLELLNILPKHIEFLTNSIQITYLGKKTKIKKC